MSDVAAVALALAAAAGAFAALPVPLPLGVAIAAVAFAFRRPGLLCAGAALLASGLAARSWAGLDAPTPTRVAGVVTLVSDPEWAYGGVRVVLRSDGRRYEAWARGEAADLLSDRLAGERVWVAGTTRPLEERWRTRLASRHIAARLSITRTGGWAPGDPVSRLANRLRRTLIRGTASLPDEQRSLFAGLVLGDDRDQSPEVTDAFRAAGLTHLLAVSGQNVALVLALAGPLLRRLQLRPRLLATIAVIGFFGLVTRFEPSVLRASAMAALAATASMLGRQASGLRLLGLAVAGLLIVDPLLVHSVGFLMSAGASAGILLLSQPLARRMPGPRWLADAAAVTVAAQIGVAPVSVPVFGGVPLASLPANLLAAPAAGPVVAWGLGAGLPAGLAGGVVAALLHVPTRLLVGWIDGVAVWASTLPIGSVRLVHVIVLGAAGLVWIVRRRLRVGSLECSWRSASGPTTSRSAPS